MKKLKMSLYLVSSLLALALLLPDLSVAAACTPGTNCYCDKVKNVSNPIYDPNLLFCEDWEAPTLRLNQGVGNGPPWYGPNYDDSDPAYLNNRGDNSYLMRRYGVGVGWVSVRSPNPVNPTLGPSCAYPQCWGHTLWHPTNLWSDNNNFPSMGIFTAAADFDDIIPTNHAPTGAAGGGTGVFDGNGTIAYIVQTDVGHTGGFFGSGIYFPTTYNLGITKAAAYPANLAASRVLCAPWKHTEYGASNMELFESYNYGGCSVPDAFPFSDAFTWNKGSPSIAQCQAVVAAATIRKGFMWCNGSGLLWRPNSIDYRQSVNFPLETWGCLQGYFSNMNSTNMGIKLWVNNVLIFDVDHINDSIFTTSDGIGQFGMNAYANINIEQAGMAQVTYRFDDNIHIRNGAPVSCAQIGFGSGGSGGTSDITPPNPPTNLTVN